MNKKGVHTDLMDPETSKKLSENAKKQPRDAKGHFIKAETDPLSTTATTLKATSPVETISHPQLDPELEKPLVSFSIQNPFKKILYWLNDIRKKQTTTFDLKVSVPLIALPIFLVVVGGALQYMFTLGQKSVSTSRESQTTPTSKTIPKSILISKVGIIKATYQVLAATDSNISPTVIASETEGETKQSPTPLPTATPTPTLTPTPTSPPPSRYVLVDKNEQIYFLLTPPTISLQKYQNQRVLITGLYDQSKETIEIKQSSDIEVLP